MKSDKFSPEVRERAVRMVQQHLGGYPSLWAAIGSIASKIGCASKGEAFIVRYKPKGKLRALNPMDCNSRRK